MSKVEQCLFSTFDEYICNNWLCLRFGDDRLCKCDNCPHFIIDNENEVKRIKYEEV